MDKKKKPIRLSDEALKERIKQIRAVYKKKMLHPERLHVKLQKGTEAKLGWRVYHTSRIPILDCCKCCKRHCAKICYDFHHDLRTPNCINDRVRNSIIVHTNRPRYWSEVDLQIKANFIDALRINVGGELDDEDFPFVAKLGRDNPQCRIMFFTKNYDGINTFLDTEDFPENVHPILSIWKGVPYENPHNLPCAHILYADGTTTAPSYGAIYCRGTCTECLFHEKGCWTLQKGQHLLLDEH